MVLSTNIQEKGAGILVNTRYSNIRMSIRFTPLSDGRRLSLSTVFILVQSSLPSWSVGGIVLASNGVSNLASHTGVSEECKAEDKFFFNGTKDQFQDQ